MSLVWEFFTKNGKSIAQCRVAECGWTKEIGKNMNVSFLKSHLATSHPEMFKQLKAKVGLSRRDMGQVGVLGGGKEEDEISYSHRHQEHDRCSVRQAVQLEGHRRASFEKKQRQPDNCLAGRQA